MKSKNRILFVDDEPLVLQGLQRLLRSMRAEWEMEFLDGGAKALARMAESTFDVIVSDMLMPGMNGVEFLGQVKERFPASVRIILSGHSELQLIMKCVGVAHQYLAKPCDADALYHILKRATTPGFTLWNELLLSTLSQADRLPSLPSLYIEINKVLEDPEVGIDAVGGIIARDIGMTAQILKLVNSAFFGLPRHVSDPAEAASYLGVELLKSLVLSLHVFSQFEHAHTESFSVDKLWQHSLLVAALAKLVAQAENAPDRVVKEAFSAGILHDAGKLVLVSNFPSEMDRILHSIRVMGVKPDAAEREIFGATHAEAGGYLLGMWGLPVGVVDAITFHHAPDVAPVGGFSALTAVHVADHLAHQIASPIQGYPAPPLNDVYLQQLELSQRLPIWEDVARQNSSSMAA